MLSEGSSTIIPQAEQPFTRLHITPLTSSLLPTILGASLSAEASDISYHAVPTFPENNYGYLTLPTASAQALRKKLNGTTLRGVKMRVEEARPEKKRKLDEAEGKEVKRQERKRGKLETGVLPAVELPEGRHVKRGWTGDGVKNKSKDSKHMKGKRKGELAFRTHLPADVPSNDTKNGDTVADSATPTRRRKRVELKEFENSTSFPKFLRDSGKNDTAPSAAFVEGKGWVDNDGQLVESAPKSSRKNNLSQRTEASSAKNTKHDLSDDGSSTSSVLSSSSASSLASDESSSDDSVESQDNASPLASTELAARAAVTTPTSVIPSSEAKTPGPTKEVHPLEALFKKPAAPNPGGDSNPRSRPAPIKTTFSFGLEDSDLDDSTVGSTTGSVQIPQTPFTRQDLENRGVRSAAPTPDTAAIGKRFTWRGSSYGDEDDDEGDDDHDIDDKDEHDINGPVDGEDLGDEGQNPDQNEFERLFYAQRGENNRAAKSRKREAKKAARQAQNRRVGVGR